MVTGRKWKAEEEVKKAESRLQHQEVVGRTQTGSYEAMKQSYDLCGTTNTSLQHILSGSNIALTQGCFRWRHDQVLRKLAEVAEGKRTEAKRESQVRHQRRITFLKQGEPADTSNSTPAPKLLAPGLEWKLEVDLGRQLHFALAGFGAVVLGRKNCAPC